MDSLGDFIHDDVTGGETELHLMNIEYTEHYGSPLVHLFCRDENDEFHHIEVRGHEPSFYVHEDAWTERMGNHQHVERVEPGHTSIEGKPLVRVYCSLPKHVAGRYDNKGLRDYFDDTWEADVFFTSRFLIDTGIYTHFSVDFDEATEGQHLDGDYRVHVDDITTIDDPDWRATPRTVTVDIEVESPDGFPEASEADQPVTAITAHDNYRDEYRIWVLRHPNWLHDDREVRNMAYDNAPGVIEVDETEIGVAIDEVSVHENEAAMLESFNQWVGDARPDMLSGWNSSAGDSGDAFDYPYLYNRAKSLNVSSFVEWSPMNAVWTKRRGREQNLVMDGSGITFFDMMQSYKKTQWQEPKGGWGLANISSTELSAGKLDIDGIDAAWKDDVGTFLEYNIRDVQAVVGIDEAAGVTELFQNVRSLAGVQFDNCHNNIDLLDVFILRYADEMGLALPTNEEPERGWYYGAKVFTPMFGRHPNVVYPDVWSMYPNQIRNVNMSPETIIGTAGDLADSNFTEEDCRWTYVDTRPTNVKEDSDPQYEKLYFLKPNVKEGFMTQVVDDLMGMKDHYDGTELYDAVKRIVNSVYGVYGDSDSYGKGYRLFDWRIAEGITLGGRKMITDSSERFVDALNDIKADRGIGGNEAYRVGGDTDSVMSAIPFMDAADYDDYADIVDLAQEAADRVNDWYDEWVVETYNLVDGQHYCELEIESYAPWAYVPEPTTASAEGKKRYAEIIAWDEGEWLDPPSFSVTGIDIVRSDRAEVTRETLEDVLQAILRIDDPAEARREVYDIINDEVRRINEGERPNHWIARPRGMSQQPEKYGSPTETPMPTYRGAKYANEHFDWEHITSGAKPMLLYIDDVRGSWPATYPRDWSTKEAGDDVDAVACEDPDKLPEDFIIDTEKMIEKTLKDPLTPILAPMGWDFDEALDATTRHGMQTDQDQTSVAQFM